MECESLAEVRACMVGTTPLDSEFWRRFERAIMTPMSHTFWFGRGFGLAIGLAALGGSCFADKVPVRPARTYQLRNVEWHLTILPTEGTIEGDVINSLTLLKPESEVAFDCGPLRIASITVNGTSATSTRKGETLTVQLPDKGAAKDYKVEIRYSGKPTAGIYFIDPDASYPAHSTFVYSIGTPEDNRYWLPTYDFPDNKATSEGFITIPRGWKALSNGKYEGMATVGDRTTVHWKLSQPHSTYLISFVAGKYDVGEEKWGKIPVQYWVPEGLADWGKTTFGGTNKIIDFYSRQLGFKYPYPKFAQSTVPQFIFGGVENITAVTQSIDALIPPDEAGLRDSTGLVAHELAHQWFGDTISPANWTHTWLSESFATLMPPFCTRASKGNAAYQRERKGIFQGALAMRNNGPVAWDDFNYPGDVYRGQIYSGGGARLFMLMDKLGEKRFWAGIRQFLKTYAFQPVTTEQFFSVMSQVSGEDLTPFMRQWFYGSGVPEISGRVEGTSLVFKLSHPGFDLDPEVWIWDRSKQNWQKRTLHFSTTVSEARIEVGADLASAPTFVDPEGHYLLSTHPLNTIPGDEVEAIFRKIPIYSRDVTFGVLRQHQDGVTRLFANPPKDVSPSEILSLFDAKHADVVLSLTHSPDPRIRSAALSAFRSLGASALTDANLEIIREISAKDKDPLIRQSAFSILLRQAKTAALAEQAWGMDVYKEGYRTDALSWWESHDPTAARKHCLEALDRPMSEPVQSAAIRMLGRLGDAKGERTVFEHLVKVVQSREIILRQSAINALAGYGDKAAIPVLEPLTHLSLFIAREAAERAIEALKN